MSRFTETHETDQPAEVAALRASNPNDSVLLERSAGLSWLRWLPGHEQPIQLPPGGVHKARYNDGKERPF